MNELQNKLRTLKLKKAMLLSNIEALSEVDESLFTQLGKVVAEIAKVEKEIFRKTENIFE
jgi:diadenosine tetraphosphate (Ap4A) HIT family hydrolase